MRAQNSDRFTLEQTLQAMRRIHSATPEIAEQIANGYSDGFEGRIGEGEKTGRYWISHRHGSEARQRGAHGVSGENSEGAA